MNILFIGAVKSSYEFLKILLEIDECNIVGLVTKRKKGINSDFVDLSPLCQSNNIPINYYESDKAMMNFISSLNPDIIYCFGWSKLLSPEIFCLAPKGVIGFHPTKLPHNRGRHPIIWSLVLGLEETASTFFQMDDGADSGEILSQEVIKIENLDNAESLYNKVISIGKSQLVELTKSIKHQTIKPIKQDDSKANVWRKRTKEDGKIDFRMSAKSIYNLVRALSYPYVGAHFEYCSKDYKVWEVSILNDSKNEYINYEPGKIVDVYSRQSFLIKASDNLIYVKDCDEIDIRKGDYL